MPKTGYIVILGRPNAGKSTFINTLIGAKVSAVSARPQMTQHTIPAIYTDTDQKIQMIFLDTPGIRKLPQNTDRLSEYINHATLRALSRAHVILRFLDPTRAPGTEDAYIDTVLSSISKPILFAETKQDILRAPYKSDHQPLYCIDSTTKKGYGELIQAIAALLPDGPFLYESDYYTDQNTYFRIQEIIREQLFLLLHEEVPYACYIEIATLEEKNNGTLLSILAYIHTETDSQRHIIVGKNGSKIQEIGTASRIILEEIFGKKVFLSLRVKTKKNWRKNETILKQLFEK